MSENPVEIDVLDVDHDVVEVRYPTLNVPVRMTYNYFKSRMQQGYFKIRKRSYKRLPKVLRSMLGS